MGYKIEQDYKNCIGCGACVAICPKFWVMDGVKAKPKKTEFDEKDLKCNKEVAESCPANVIHLFKDKKKII